MFAITQDKPGGPKTLRWEKAPDPTPGPNEVIIDIAASDGFRSVGVAVRPCEAAMGQVGTPRFHHRLLLFSPRRR